MNQLADRIQAIHNKAWLTQQWFAVVLGIYKNTIGRWERRQAEPDLNYTSLLCKKFATSLYWLLNGEDSMLNRNRNITLEIKPGMKSGELRGHKLSEVRGDPEFDTTMARLQGKRRKLIDTLPEERKNADMKKAFLYHQIKYLEAKLRERQKDSISCQR